MTAAVSRRGRTPGLSPPIRLLAAALSVFGLLLTGSCGTTAPPGPSAPGPGEAGSQSSTGSAAPAEPSAPATQSPAPTVVPSATAATAVPSPQGSRCADLADSLSLRDRIGQLMMVAVSSDGVSSAAADAIDDSRAGSVLLLGNTSAGRIGVRRVTDRARVAARTPAGIETMVAADQEGGLVQRLQGDGFDPIPSPERQARKSPAELTGEAKRWGKQLRRSGIDANLAPVADVVPKKLRRLNQPVGALRRGYGSNPDSVAEHVAAFVVGMDAAGIATSVKHFPGLGQVRGNTDFAAKVVDPTTTATDPYLKPFAAGVDAGTDMVMVSSAYYSEIDPRRRAAFSATVINQMIRAELGFTGVVISDDLAAVAMRDLKPGDRMLRFLRAGGDLAIVGDPGIATSMAEAVADQARDDGDLAVSIEQATIRVLQLKERRGLADC
ncbi:MAG: glycoside hydrolase family 3 [Microlunatus sp.]|nr:glycoside hydrolase family 3 [Microlunatus sp.]